MQCLECVPGAVLDPAQGWSLWQPHVLPSGGASPVQDSTAVPTPQCGWAPPVAQPLHHPGAEKQHRCVTAPLRAQYGAEQELSFLHTAGSPSMCGQGLPATVPGNDPCWSQGSYIHPSALGSLWLDNHTLFPRLQTELGKQIICNFGAVTFLF